MRRHQSVNAPALKPFDTSQNTTSQPVNTPATQAAPTIQRSAQIVSQPVQTPTISRTISQSISSSVPTNITKRPERISIRPTIITPQQEPQQTVVTQAVTRNSPFSKEDLERVWMTIPGEVECDGRQRAALLNTTLALDGTKVAIFFNNTMQVHNMMPLMSELKKLLADRLSNDLIELEYKVDEQQQKSSYVSVNERYNYLVSKNKELDSLKTMLELQSI